MNTKDQQIVQFKIIKMVNFMLYGLYLSKTKKKISLKCSELCFYELWSKQLTIALSHIKISKQQKQNPGMTCLSQLPLSSNLNIQLHIKISTISSIQFSHT